LDLSQRVSNTFRVSKHWWAHFTKGLELKGALHVKCVLRLKVETDTEKCEAARISPANYNASNNNSDKC
jgi:hypothetical protein